MQEYNLRTLKHVVSAKLRPLPQSLAYLLDLCHRNDATIEELAQVIKTDAVLTSKILALTVTSSSGKPSRLRTFEQLITTVGSETVRAMAFTTAVGQFFQPDTVLDKFNALWWFHSLLTGHAAKLIATATCYLIPDEAYIAGLLHDIGKLILRTSLNLDYEKMLSEANKRDVTLITLEHERIGANHAEVGAALIRSWQSQTLIADAVLYHHEPEHNILDSHQLVKIVHLANRISQLPDSPDIELTTATEMLGLRRQDILEVAVTARNQALATAKSIGIDIEDLNAAHIPEQLINQARTLQGPLSQEIRHLALCGSIQNLLSNVGHESILLQSIKTTANMLFGVNNLIIFIYNPTNNSISSTNAFTQNPMVRELLIPVREGRSLAVQAIIDNQQVCSFDFPSQTKLTVIDKQLIEHLGGVGILCLPMIVNKTIIGSIVLGLEQEQQKQMEPNLLDIFAPAVAAAIHASLNKGKQQQRLAEDDRVLRELKLRETIHEASNPLSIIRNYTQILSVKLGADHPASEDLKIIKEEIERVGETIRGLFEEPNNNAAVTKSVAINDLIRDLTQIFRGSLSAAQSITVNLDLNPDLPVIISDGNAIKQLLTNLIKNAIEAMPKKGEVTIRTQDRINVNSQNYVEITVADNGPGLPEQILNNLFEPTVSTKGGEHAGLGLSIVRGLVSEMGGYISCRSDKTGTIFQILLPRLLSNMGIAADERNVM